MLLDIQSQLKSAFRDIPQIVYRVSDANCQRIIMASSVTLVDIEEPTMLVCVDTKEKNDPLLHSEKIIVDYLEDPKANVHLDAIMARFRFYCTHMTNVTYGSHNVIFLSIDKVEEWESENEQKVWLRGNTHPIMKQDDLQSPRAA